MPTYFLPLTAARVLLICVLISGCQSVQKPQEEQPDLPADPVVEVEPKAFDLISRTKNMLNPVGASYNHGAGVFRDSSGAGEARAVYKSKGLTFLVPTDEATILGVDGSAERSIRSLVRDKQARLVRVPGYSKVKPPRSGDEYANEVRQFIIEFNGEMARLGNNIL